MANKTKATNTVKAGRAYKDEIDIIHTASDTLTDRERKGTQNVLLDAMDCLGGSDALLGVSLLGTVKIFTGATPSVSISLVAS